MLEPGVGSPMAAAAVSAGALGGIGAGVAQFAAAAASGAFAVNETGGQAILSAIRNVRDRIDQIRSEVGTYGRQVPLGLSHGAHVMSKVDSDVAQDEQGFIPTLMKFRESLDAAEQGINDAIRNYAAMDERGAGRQQSA